MRTITLALRTVVASPLQLFVGATSCIGFLVLYLLTLPAAFTGGRGSREETGCLD